MGGRGEGDTVDKQMVANKESVLHGAGRNDEVLAEEGENEEADDEDGADGGDSLKRRLFYLFRFGFGEWFLSRRDFFRHPVAHALNGSPHLTPRG
jgi:hypothetical protein